MSKQFKKRPVILFLVSLLLVPTAVFAKTISVKKNGTGSYTTIQTAVNAANAGDIIEIYNGTYKENVNIEKSGSASQYYTIAVASNETVIVDGQSGEYTFNLSPGNYWKFDGSGGTFIIKNGNFGIRTYKASNVEIKYLTVTRDIKGGDSAISFEGSSNNGSVHHCIINSYDGYGIINSSTGGSDNIVYYSNDISNTEVGTRHTRSADCKAYNNYIHDLVSNGHGVYGVYLRDTQRALVYNNVIYNVPTSSGNGIHIYDYGGTVSESCLNNKVYNNTIDRAYKGIRQNGGSGNVFRNNLIINSADDAIEINRGDAIVSNTAFYNNKKDIDLDGGNIIDEGNLINITDISLAIQNSGKRPIPYYVLVSDSNFINDAGTLALANYDYSYHAFAGNPPIGAFDIASMAPAPASPKNLRIIESFH